MAAMDVAQNMRARAREQTRRLKERLDRLKENKSCADCELSWPAYVLTFDFTTKDFLLTPEVTDRRLHQIAESDLVCANCLRIRIYKRTKSD